MKNKKVISKIITTAAIPIMLLTINGATMAHGPDENFSNPDVETSDLYPYGYECELSDIEASWPNNQENRDLCNPDSYPENKDLIADILSDGITQDEYPYGLCFASFNNFTNYTNSDGTGKDPYRSDTPPLFRDERNFLRATNDSNPLNWSSYGNTYIDITEGDEVTFMFYIHNNGDPCLNDYNLNRIPDGKYYSDWNTTAHDARVSLLPPQNAFFYQNNELYLPINESTYFQASIWARDAINRDGTKNAPTTNGFTINPDQELILEYKENSAIYTDYAQDWDINRHSISQEYVTQFLGINGMPLSTVVNQGDIPGSTLKGEEGDYYACEPYIGVIQLTFEAKTPPPNNCTSLSINPPVETGILNREPLYELSVNTVTFQEEIPENLRAFWNSEDPEGRFYTKTSNGSYEAAPPYGESDATGLIPYEEKIYYTGDGPISVELYHPDLTEEQLNRPVCSARTEIELPVCASATLQAYDAEDFTGSTPENRPDEITCMSEQNGLVVLLADFFTPDNEKVYGEKPEEIKVKWETTDPEGRFYDMQTPGGFADEVIHQGPNIFYQGGGTVTATLMEIDGVAEPADTVCTKILEPCEIPDEICEVLNVNHQDPITVGTVSEFRATAFDDNQAVFPGKIRYSVDRTIVQGEGEPYGYFSLEKPMFTRTNPAEAIDEGGIPPLHIITDILGPIVVDVQIPESEEEEDVRTDIVNGILGINFGVTTGNQAVTELNIGNLTSIYSTANQVEEKNLELELDDPRLNIPGAFPLGNNVFAIDIPQTFTLENDLSRVLQPVDLTINEVEYFEEIEVEPGTLVYFRAVLPGENKIHLKTIDENNNRTGIADCERDFDIEAAPITCDFLELTVKEDDENGTTVTELEPGKKYYAVAETTYTDPTYNNTVTFSVAGAGFFIGETVNNASGADRVQALDNIGVGQLALNIADRVSRLELISTVTVNEGEAVYFATLSGATESIGDALIAVATGYGDTPDCVQALDLIVEEEEEETECISIDVEIREGAEDGEIVTSLVPGEIYYITGEATLEPDEDHTITYRSHNAGVFISTEEDEEDEGDERPPSLEAPADERPPELERPDSDESEQPPSLSAADPFGEQTITANEGETIIFVTFPNITENIDDALRANVTGYYNDECDIIFPLVVTPEEDDDDDEEIECLDLELMEPDSPWRLDPDRDEDEEEYFRIEVETSPADEADQLTYIWEITRGDGEWKYNSDGEWEYDGDEESNTFGILFNYLRNFDEDTIVEIYAENFKEDENGDPLCFATISARERQEDEPEIDKFVFKDDDVDDRATTLNINENQNYVTYAVRYTVGSEKSVEITETQMENGTIEGNQGGELKFEGMIINIIDENDDDEYSIYKTNDYDEDSDSNNPWSDKYYTDRSDDFEDDWMCEDDEDENFCIEGDEDDIEDNFKDGEPIKFRNVDELGAGSTILIKYQMEVDTVINDEYCKEMTTAEGCGESFENEAEFEAYADDDFTNRTYQDDDDAEVIVVCPYILTRAGGDVFFHDVLDTGVDVAYCSEVRGATGPGITPRPEEDRDVTSTGEGGEESPLVLDLPSHDVCRYSNLEENIEGYNDVLKNFSSTICELQAEVAEEWTTKNITEKIKANIERISRWGGNLNDFAKISNLQQLENMENAESGVFVKDNGDLTIGSNGTGLNQFFEINSTDTIPGGQTYIVKDHDLYINNNIKYNDTSTNFAAPDTIPSAAFIVINGDIIIDNAVTRIDGIIMAVNTDPLDSEAGKITNGNIQESTYSLLTINGSLIGNVYELFATRLGIGDPTKDQGSVTIRYDERILLNTPPGISELIDITQLRVAE